MVFLHFSGRSREVRILTNPPKVKSGVVEEIPEELVATRLSVIDGVVVSWSCLTYTVYTLTLSDGARVSKKMIEQNPDVPVPKGFLYVGMTGVPVEERISNHLRGYKSCRLVCDFFVSPLPERYERNLSFEKASRRERELAVELRKEGYWVYQN